MILFIDTETKSSRDLFKCGLHAYSEAEDAAVMIVTYAVDDGEVQAWDRTETLEMPADLEEGLLLADEYCLQNAPFDLVMMALPYPQGLGLQLDLSRVWCTMAQAYAHGLPGALGKLCEIFRVGDEDAKDKRGRELIRLFCVPPYKGLKRGWADRNTHPVEWAEFLEYAKSDIRAMRVLRHKMPSWNFRDDNQLRERTYWRMTHEMNLRGVLLDMELADAAIQAVGDNKLQLDAQIEEYTGGDVQSANQRDAFLAHILKEYGVDLPDLKGSTLEKRAKDEALPQEVRDLLVLRMETATTSTAKYGKMKKVVSHDNRARGLIQYCGAARTGRDGGRLIQPQNYPRPTMGEWEIEECIDLLKAGELDLLRLLQPSIPKMASNALRGTIIAPPGKKLVVSDLSNIEGVTAAWLAGETWKLEAYRASFADKSKPDLYRLAYARSFGVDPMSISIAQRQLGKIQELALAYEGGVGAFVTFVLTYRMDIDAVAAAVLPVLAPDVYEQALGMLNWTKSKGRSTYGLSDDVYIACEALKYLWRQAHPEISGTWPELKDTFVRAVHDGDRYHEARRLTFKRDGAWVRMILPSGRSICYPSPEVKGEGKYAKVTYAGVSQYTHQWGRIGTYGGKLFENACQAVARDVLFDRLPDIEAAGYDVLLRVHDEVICEAPDTDDFNEAHLSSILATQPWWAEGLPLKAAGFEAYRYHK